jgi:hypothetical protein
MSEDSSRDVVRPRYCSAPLPPYSYVPGFTPHPVSDPSGHMFGQAPEPPAPPAADEWQASEAYRYGIDLFNHGYYWEAHEAWESLWHAAGRKGTVATWLKALIKLAAAVVKAREGNAAGVLRHARRSLELLEKVLRESPESQQTYCGVSVQRVQSLASSLRRHAAQRYTQPQPNLILNDQLELASPAVTAPH